MINRELVTETKVAKTTALEQFSFSAILDMRAERTPELVAFHFLPTGTSENVDTLTYSELQARTNAVALRLMRTVQPGQRVLLALRPGFSYIAALLGIFQSGAIAVPAFPPTNRRTTERMQSIIGDCKPTWILLDDPIEARFCSTEEQLPGVSCLSINEAFFRQMKDSEKQTRECINPALLQYTSGSTGNPKGVMLTHENLISNCQALAAHIGDEQDRAGLSWLPPYHDMGLIGTILHALYGGWTLTMMSPEHFVQSPSRWLRAITEFRATISVTPNFGLDLCASIAEDELDGIDLSSLRQLFCGSETIQSDILTEFRNRFAPYGYRDTCLIPCYGLAEATLFVTGRRCGEEIKIEHVDRTLIAQGIAQITTDEESAAKLVSCGTPAAGNQVRIVDPALLTSLPEGTIGEVWIRGSHVAAGYYKRPEESARTFGGLLSDDNHQPYLRSGDLGYLRGGQLFITGRLSDLIIIAGRNLYPDDIEGTVNSAHKLVRRSAAVAIDERTEHILVIVAEVRGSRQNTLELDAVRSRVIAAVNAAYSVRPHDVLFVRSGGLPRTTSGKIRRNEVREMYLQQKASSSDALKISVLPTSATRIDQNARRWAFVTIGASTLGFIAAIVFSLYFGFSLLYLSLFAGMYFLTSFGIEGGFHRCFSHGAFRVGSIGASLFGIAGSMAAQGPILFWVAIHRKHHAFADRDGDPHSPRSRGTGRLARLRGFWHGHVGWMFTIPREDRMKFVHELAQDGQVWSIDRYYGLWVLLGLLLPAAIALIVTGQWVDAIGGLLWGGFARIFALDHVTWAVNSLGHTLGNRMHATRDSSQNLSLLALASFGGAWHNNHHAQPSLAHNGHQVWQIDPTGFVIRVLDHAGLIEGVRYPERFRSSKKER